MYMRRGEWMSAGGAAGGGGRLGLTAGNGTVGLGAAVGAGWGRVRVGARAQEAPGGSSRVRVSSLVLLRCAGARRRVGGGMPRARDVMCCHVHTIVASSRTFPIVEAAIVVVA